MTPFDQSRPHFIWWNNKVFVKVADETNKQRVTKGNGSKCRLVEEQQIWNACRVLRGEIDCVELKGPKPTALEKKNFWKLLHFKPGNVEAPRLPKVFVKALQNWLFTRKHAFINIEGHAFFNHRRFIISTCSRRGMISFGVRMPRISCNACRIVTLGHGLWHWSCGPWRNHSRQGLASRWWRHKMQTLIELPHPTTSWCIDFFKTLLHCYCYHSLSSFKGPRNCILCLCLCFVTSVTCDAFLAKL